MCYGTDGKEKWSREADLADARSADSLQKANLPDGVGFEQSNHNVQHVISLENFQPSGDQSLPLQIPHDSAMREAISSPLADATDAIACRGTRFFEICMLYGLNREWC